MAEELINNLSSSIIDVGNELSLRISEIEPDARLQEVANKLVLSWISNQICRLAFDSDISEEECINLWNKTYPDYQIRVRKWHTIEDFPNFEVSNDGLVRNTKTKHYATKKINDEGRCSVMLNDDQRHKKYYVNVLVATYFCCRPEGTQINGNGNWMTKYQMRKMMR
jgi:hypothetical protein